MIAHQEEQRYLVCQIALYTEIPNKCSNHCIWSVWFIYITQPHRRWQMTLIIIPTPTKSIPRISTTVKSPLPHQMSSTGNNICRSKVRKRPGICPLRTAHIYTWSVTLSWVHPLQSVFPTRPQTLSLMVTPCVSQHHLFSGVEFKHCKLKGSFKNMWEM